MGCQHLELSQGVSVEKRGGALGTLPETEEEQQAGREEGMLLLFAVSWGCYEKPAL